MFMHPSISGWRVAGVDPRKAGHLIHKRLVELASVQIYWHRAPFHLSAGDFGAVNCLNICGSSGHGGQPNAICVIFSVVTSTMEYEALVIRPGNNIHAQKNMMTSSNGNVFPVTGHLCGEFTGHRWIPHTKASNAELRCFLWSASE